MVPIYDNHFHLQPSGRGVDALRDFSKAGGTHAMLCHLPYAEVPISSAEDFSRSYEITIGMAERGNAETEVRVFTCVGPYPVLLLGLAERYGLPRAVEIMKGGMEGAQRLVKEGKAVAIGEIGRPHFPVPPEIWDASNDIMRYGMELAKEASCPVVLHTESSDPAVMLDLATHADRAGIARDKVVKHYSPPLVLSEENHGLFPSVLASRTSVREALSKGDRFVLETDFLDEPSRPGAVMNINTVPKRTKALLASGELTEERAFRIHKDNPERIYGIIIE
ncbi:MAG: metal-dependent hydrolase [Methanomassiliicoccus sp.]|nr:metal-dependent hydrolase [Methanomassiliicoccus sp.]